MLDYKRFALEAKERDTLFEILHGHARDQDPRPAAGQALVWERLAVRAYRIEAKGTRPPSVPAHRRLPRLESPQHRHHLSRRHRRDQRQDDHRHDARHAIHRRPAQLADLAGSSIFSTRPGCPAQPGADAGNLHPSR